MSRTRRLWLMHARLASVAHATGSSVATAPVSKTNEHNSPKWQQPPKRNVLQSYDVGYIYIYIHINVIRLPSAQSSLVFFSKQKINRVSLINVADVVDLTTD